MPEKRKATEAAERPSAKRSLSNLDIKSHFRNCLFTPESLEFYKTSYDDSQPYKHGVIHELLQPSLLRAVRSEITENISFTPKETDIYKIHQSGDLANLDGLDSAALQRLPSLVTLRDALYGHEFRDYLSSVTGAGKLSGEKTDMAVNVYTPGCHLLCHDDVIGSRRVSYILYLLDPDRAWRGEWGGALRLYPTQQKISKTGDEVAVPAPNHTVSIPPAFGQLSFFAVQPGLSYHDVEEVYARQPHEETLDDGGRVRMAISGWYHIPQEGEDGYEAGAESTQAQKSSLSQLEGKSDEFDMPQLKWFDPVQLQSEDALPGGRPAEVTMDGTEQELTEHDLEFLVKYLNPRYLVPDTVASLRELFTEDSSLRLALFLAPQCASRMHTHILKDEKKPLEDGSTIWETAVPPHKHRFLYQQATESSSIRSSDIPEGQLEQLLQILIPSLAFRKWLSLATGLALGDCNAIARRFRRGKDYSLATGYSHADPQLEVCLGLTPTEGWGASVSEEEEVDDVDENNTVSEDDETGNTFSAVQTNGKPAVGGPGTSIDEVTPATSALDRPSEALNIGGYEAYLAGDEDDDDTSSVDAPRNPSSATGAGQRRSGKADPAIYQTGDAVDEEDDGVLFNQPASWNVLTIVLRDKGTMRFVKYVSRGAPGDRWDISCSWQVTGSLEEDEESSGEERGSVSE